MIGRISRRSRTCSTGVESSRIASCCWRMMRSRSWTKLTPDGVGDPVGGRLVGVEDLVEQVEVRLVLLEQRAREHVAQQQHDAQHLVRLDASRDDPLGQVARVVLQGLDAARLEHLDVVVVDRGRLGEDLLVGHRGQQLRLGDALRPLLAQLRAVVPQVRDELT